MQHAVVRQLAVPPASPITPEYLSYNEGPLYLVIVATLVFIALSTFSLRVYTRIKLLHFFGIDDWLCSVAALHSVGALVIFIVLERLGIGKHLHALPAENLTQLVRWQWYFSLFVVIGISFVKLSVAFFLLQIIHQPYCRRFLYSMIGLLIPLTLIWLGTFVFQCVPVSEAWEPFIRSPRCLSRTTYRDLNLFNNAANTVTDLILTILPITIVWTLRVSLRTQISLVAVLGFGFLACAAAIIRISMIYNIRHLKDPLVHDAWLILWSVIEMTAGITAACLPTLQPLLTTLLTALSNLTRSRRTSHPHPAPQPNAHSTRFPSPSNHTFPPPKHAYLRRFHDPESCLDFDLETPPPRTRTHPQMHSRNASGVTNFSVPFDRTAEEMPMMRGRGLVDMEEDGRGWRGGYAVSVTSGNGEDDARAIRRVDSNEGSVIGLGGDVVEEGCGGIVRTTTMEVSVT